MGIRSMPGYPANGGSKGGEPHCSPQQANWGRATEIFTAIVAMEEANTVGINALIDQDPRCLTL